MKKRIVSALCAMTLAASMVAAPALDSGIMLVPAISASAETYGDFEYYDSYFDENCVVISRYIGNGGDVVIPSSINGKKVTGIGSTAFRDCTNVTSIDIPNSVTSIASAAFFNCSSLTSIVIPNSVTIVSGDIFALCKSLKRVSLGSGITNNIDRYFFDDCYNLISIDVDSGNPQYSSYDGVLYNKSKTEIINCPKGKTSVTIPNSMTTIGNVSFYECYRLKNITIPDSVTSIGNGAFFDCSRLTDVYYGGTVGQWNAIEIDNDSNRYLLNATIHCTDGIINPKDEPAPAKADISKATVKTSNQTYTGKSLTPAVTVTLGGKTLKKGTDYTAAYKNNKNCGKATVTVNGMNDYDGSASGSFIIKPKRSAAKKTVSPKKKQIKVTWKKTAGGVTGYQVQIALNKKFTKARKTYVVKKAASVSKTIKGLRSKKVYYTRVRAYKTVASKNYYGAWSGIKKARCK